MKTTSDKAQPDSYTPEVGTIAEAKVASRYGVFAAAIGAVLALAPVTWSQVVGAPVFDGFNGWKYWVALTLAGIAFGVSKEKRWAAVSGLVLFIAGQVYTIAATHGFNSMAFLWAGLYVGGIRGVYALHALRKSALGTSAIQGSSDSPQE